ncbi:MAG TPA: hypothetical protein VMQ73_08615 [Methylomirabilota bacterium]|nr:hypothetical protein [Methylomirabilota bacterium]
MTATWKGLSARRRAVIQEAAGALLVLDAAALTGEDADRPVTCRDLHRWLQDSDNAVPPPRIRQALGADARLRLDLDRLVQRTASWHGPRASAASSGQLDMRVGDGFQIQMKPSRAAADQVYVLIALTGALGRTPTTLVIRSAAGEYVKWPLPRPQSGVIQVLTDEASDALRLLRDPKSELYLW